jgi:hypothetical protein
MVAMHVLSAAVLRCRSLLHHLYNACCDKCGQVSGGSCCTVQYNASAELLLGNPMAPSVSCPSLLHELSVSAGRTMAVGLLCSCNIISV